MIEIDDFKKLDIRIGTIKEVELLPKSEKLLRLTIDLGEDDLGEPAIRQVLAGIAPYFNDPKVLEGKQVPVVANLEPREMMGERSEGMILAVGGEGGFSLLVPEEEVPNGSRAR